MLYSNLNITAAIERHCNAYIVILYDLNLLTLLDLQLGLHVVNLIHCYFVHDNYKSKCNVHIKDKTR